MLAAELERATATNQSQTKRTLAYVVQTPYRTSQATATCVVTLGTQTNRPVQRSCPIYTHCRQAASELNSVAVDRSGQV